MDSQALVISFFERVYNQKEFDYVFTIFAENYYEHTETGARTDHDAYNIIKGACLIFPDLQVEVNEIIAKNDEIVAVRLTFSATHKGTFLGIEATNKTITFEAMEFFKVVDGLIVESWGNWPIYDMLQMLSN